TGAPPTRWLGPATPQRHRAGRRPAPACGVPTAHLPSGRRPGVAPISCRPALPPAQRLAQVMLQVIDVIHEQPRQGDFRTAADPTGRPPALLRHAPGDVQQVRVVGPPQVDQFRPPGRLVALDADPLLLLVAGEVLPGGDLAPDEALVVVRGRVDQVADDFLLG